MIRFPTNLIVLEGPDASGKSSLYQDVHKHSSFKWNIQDRSWLSMLVYGIMYGRDTSALARGMWEELTCLNNRMVFVLPPWQTIKERFEKRGDDFQNEDSLKRVYSLFEEKDWLFNMPNVLHLDNAELDQEESAAKVAGWVLTKEEDFGLDEIAAEVLRFVSNMPFTSEAKDCESTLNFTFYDDVVRNGSSSPCLEEYDVDIEDELLTDEEEGEYYKEITEKFMSKVKNELNGFNEYSEEQTLESRRFVYADDRCISFIQAMFRNKTLDFHVVLRSSNVAKTFHKDLKFLHFLASHLIEDCPEFWDTRDVRFRFNINSAHLVR